MLLRDILHRKGTKVHTISPTASLADVVDDLVANNVGSLVVMDDGHMAGIITERDILRATAARRGPLEKTLVHRHMTSQVITAQLDDDVAHTMGVMTEHRVRHLPVVELGRVVGMISIGDLVKAQHDQLCLENHYLMSYIQS